MVLAKKPCKACGNMFQPRAFTDEFCKREHSKDYHSSLSRFRKLKKDQLLLRKNIIENVLKEKESEGK